MKKINIALFMGMAFALIFSDFMDFDRNYNDIQKNVLRLHIIANSDSDSDQSLKLKVRDEILRYSDEIFGQSENINEAEMNLSGKFEMIEEIADRVIKKNGFSYTAKAELVNMNFDEKVYDDITMPSGNYDALRITLGQAQGHNWWCVMYPPLCLPVEGVAEEYFTDKEADILYNPEKYEIKFKCVEILDKFKKKLS